MKLVFIWRFLIKYFYIARLHSMNSKLALEYLRQRLTQQPASRPSDNSQVRKFVSWNRVGGLAYRQGYVSPTVWLCCLDLQSTILFRRAKYRYNWHHPCDPGRFWKNSSRLERKNRILPDYTLVVKIPHGDIAVWAAGETYFIVRTNGKSVAGRCLWVELSLCPRGRTSQVPNAKSGRFSAND